MAVVYINIRSASTTFARDTPEVKNYVLQTKQTPSELLEVKRTPATNCGKSTTGYELLREFASACEPQSGASTPERSSTPKYASDTSLHLNKKGSERNAKSKTLKQYQRSSFVSYVDFGLSVTTLDTPRLSAVSSRRRVKSDGYDPEDLSQLSEELTDDPPPVKKTLPVQTRVTRPESYMFALGSQNAINTSHFRDLPPARIDERRLEDEFV